MKLKYFRAKNVHEYLDFDVTFRPDVNFFAGLNGSGKTTALKLIMAMLTPDIEQLKNISFNAILLQVEKEGNLIDIECVKDKSRFSLSVSLNGSRVGEYSHDPELRKTVNKSTLWFEKVNNETNSAINEIEKLDSPMFLSLDRRFIKTARNNDLFENEYEHRINSKIEPDSLEEAISIIANSNSRARIHQSRIDKTLRDDIIKNALSFTRTPNELQLPNMDKIESILSKYKEIENTLESLQISSNEFTVIYESFFKRMSELARKIEKNGTDALGVNEDSGENTDLMYEWLINQSHLQRIDTLFNLVQRYQTKKSKIYSELSRFETLVNNFLSETGKEVVFRMAEKPKIKLNGVSRNISVLSSGESQILIMLTHLVLNKKLPKNGVFIIDEPELSLHISWQDMFVEAVQAANPDLQIILATHSPAIIGGRNDMYVPLNTGN